MKCIRVLEYEGPENWILGTLANPLAIHGEVKMGDGKFVREISVTFTPGGEDKDYDRRIDGV